MSLASYVACDIKMGLTSYPYATDVGFYGGPGSVQQFYPGFRGMILSSPRSWNLKE